MAVLPMGGEPDQESMFEEQAGFVGLQAYQPPEELSYEEAGEFPTSFSDTMPSDPMDSEVAEAAASPSETLGSEDAMRSGESEQPVWHPVPHLVSHAEAEAESRSAPEPRFMAAPEPPAALTVDDFAALEDRVLRAVSLVRSERQARAAAEERSLALEAQILAQTTAIDGLEQEVQSLRGEREQVRKRVERLLGQLDALEI